MMRVGSFRRVAAPVAIAPGVTLTMRMASSIEIGQAEAEAGAIVADFLRAPVPLLDFGLEDLAGDAGDDLRKMLGLSGFLTAALVFEQVVEDWAGVGDEDGRPLPLNRANIGRFLMHPEMKKAFETKAYAWSREARAEGNGSAALPNGTGGAADPIATDAG